jgi:hypothetical protein
MCEQVLILLYVVWSTVLGLCFYQQPEYVSHLEGKEGYMLLVTQESDSVFDGGSQTVTCL